jgi:hypothetical protein
MLVARTVPEIEVYLRDQPETLDYTLCVIDIAPVLDLARQRGDYGDAIGKLLAREAAAVQPAEDAQDASVAPPDGAAVTKEQGAAAAKPRKQRCDATRPEISRALDDLDGTEAWERAGPKARLGLVDQHLNKPAGWAKARTLGRAIEDRLKSGRHIGGTSALP